MVVPSGGERTHIKGDTIGYTNPYAMVNSQYECFLEVEKSIRCSNKIEKYFG